MIHYFSLVRIINSSEVCFYTFALTRFPPLSSHSKMIDIPKELHRIDKFVEQLKQETL